MASLAKMDLKYLKKHELVHEIKVRSFELKGSEDVVELRSILRQLTKDKTPVLQTKLTLSDEELAEIKVTLEDVEQLIDSYPGKDAKSLEIRVTTRMSHLFARLDRYSSEGSETVAQVLGEVKVKCIRLNASLEARKTKLIKSMSSTFLGEAAVRIGECEGLDESEESSDSGDDFSTYTKARVLRPAEGLDRSNMPSKWSIHKWGLTFKGTENPERVMMFLERVEELRIARNVSKAQLYTSAIDLFTGDGLVWYRSTKSKVCSWDQLVAALKLDFIPGDYDDIVWDEIRNRKQAKGEKVSMFLAILKNMFSRLTVIPEESVRLKTIRRNLLPVFIARLSLIEVSSIHELEILCRRIENSLTPNKKTSPETTSYARVNTLHSKIGNCWNCNDTGHRFSACSKPLRKFCFKCGLLNETVKTCKRCNSTSKN